MCVFVVELMFAFTLLALRCVNIFYCKRGKDVETFRRWTALDPNETQIRHGRMGTKALRSWPVGFIDWLDVLGMNILGNLPEN